MCVSPITIHYDGIDGGHSMLVPCGKCVECLKTKQNDFMVRIREELLQVKKSCFVTLTYSNDTVPYFEIDGKKYLTVWKKDIKDWIKRFRTNYERATGVKGIRYFLCSEYGPKTKRPHYHAIFFGLDKKDLELALRDWSERFGFVMAKDIVYEPKSLDASSRYLSKYCSKGVFENPFCNESKSLPEFSTILKGPRSVLYFKDACVPYVFLLSTLEKVRSYSFLYSPFSWKMLRQSVSRRGTQTEVCSDWPF